MSHPELFIKQGIACWLVMLQFGMTHISFKR